MAPERTTISSMLRTTGRGMPTDGGFDWDWEDVAFFSSLLIAPTGTPAAGGTGVHEYTNANTVGPFSFSLCGTHMRKWSICKKYHRVLHFVLIVAFCNQPSICHTYMWDYTSSFHMQGSHQLLCLSSVSSLACCYTVPVDRLVNCMSGYASCFHCECA